MNASFVEVGAVEYVFALYTLLSELGATGCKRRHGLPPNICAFHETRRREDRSFVVGVSAITCAGVP